MLRGFEETPPVRIDVYSLNGRLLARAQPNGLGDPGVSSVFLSAAGDRVFFTAAER